MSSHYNFPTRNGWTVDKDLTYTHASGARVFYEQLDGSDEYDWRIQWWAVTARGEKLGPFARFHLAVRAAVPMLPLGQLELPWARCA